MYVTLRIRYTVRIIIVTTKFVNEQFFFMHNGPLKFSRDFSNFNGKPPINLFQEFMRYILAQFNMLQCIIARNKKKNI